MTLLLACDVQVMDRHGGRRCVVKVKRKVHADGPRAVKGEREYAWAEGPEEAGRSHGRSTWCTIRARGRGRRDEDGVGQVREGLGGGRTRVDIEAREWRPLGVGGFLGLGLKTEVGVRRDRATQRTLGVITEVASRRSGVAIPSLPSDERWREMDKIAPVWVKWL